jgi:aspartate ammonia-lyase
MGRTEGQDAVPMTLGQEFPHSATNWMRNRNLKIRSLPLQQNMGAAAIGTGITTSPGMHKNAPLNWQRLRASHRDEQGPDCCYQ